MEFRRVRFRSLYRRVGHPVGLFARIIAGCETRWNRAEHGFVKRRALGVLTLVLLLLVAGGLGLAAQQLLLATFGGWDWIGVAILAWPALAQRSLFDHVRAVAERIAAGDLGGARTAVGKIVGRHTARPKDRRVGRAGVSTGRCGWATET